MIFLSNSKTVKRALFYIYVSVCVCFPQLTHVPILSNVKRTIKFYWGEYRGVHILRVGGTNLYLDCVA